MNTVRKWWLLIGAVVALQGCTGTVEKPDEEGAADGSYSAGDGRGADVSASGASMGGEFGGRPLGEMISDPASPLSRRVFYFDFNSSELSAEDRNALATHARLLNEKGAVTVVLEGHADERGSREYNLALGERRAKAIERILSVQGVRSEQLQVISFGEERPAAFGHDEESWHLNRRVELIYSGY